MKIACRCKYCRKVVILTGIEAYMRKCEHVPASDFVCDVCFAELMPDDDNFMGEEVSMSTTTPTGRGFRNGGKMNKKPLRLNLRSFGTK